MQCTPSDDYCNMAAINVSFQYFIRDCLGIVSGIFNSELREKLGLWLLRLNMFS